MLVYLATDRLILRQFEANDADNLYTVEGDAAVMRFINGGQPIPYGAIRDRGLPHVLGWHARRNDYGYWAAVDRDHGAFVGWFLFRPPLPIAPDVDASEPGTIEVGYRLRRAAWGKGYATEGA